MLVNDIRLSNELIVLEGFFSIASLFVCYFSYLWRVARSLCTCRASCLLYVARKLRGVMAPSLAPVCSAVIVDEICYSFVDMLNRFDVIRASD